MNQESKQSWPGAVPPSVQEKLHQELRGKEVFSAKHLIEKCHNSITDQPLTLDDLKPGRIVFLINSFGEIGAVYRLIGLHPVEPAEKNLWVVEPLPISRAYNLGTIKRARRAILDKVFEDLEESEEDLLARFEKGERIRMPARWEGKVAMALQDERLGPDERDQMKSLLFE